MTSEEKLDIKIGTKEEAFWTSVRKKCEQNIIDNHREITIQIEIQSLAKRKIKEEEENRKV